MIIVTTNKLTSSCITTLLISLFLVGCGTPFVASKQDDLMTQIDVWSAENEYGKAFSTLHYVKASHPQYQQLQIREKLLLVQANEYEVHIDKQIHKYIIDKQWSKALDLLDQAKQKYPINKTDNRNRSLATTEKILLEKQKKALASINQHITLKRANWMIEVLPLYGNKLKTDPRNIVLKKRLNQLNKEAKTLSQKMTIMSQQAIKKEHYKTARIRINLAIALESSKQRQKILSQLKKRSKNSYLNDKKKKIKIQKLTQKKHYTSLLYDIEKSYNTGNFLQTKQLILQLDENDQKNIELVELMQELDRSIEQTIQTLMNEANRNYTNGQFQQAIILWERVLMYEPENVLAKKNMQRAVKAIEKLSKLREKQIH